MGKITWWRILGICAVMLCAFPVCQAEAAGKQEQLQNKLIQGYEKYAQSVSVEEMRLSVHSAGDKELIRRAMEKVLNETTGLFYCGREYSVSADGGTGQILKIRLKYDKRYLSGSKVNTAKIKKVRRQLASRVSSALKQVKRGMSDVEKALVLHDYLARSVTYTDSASVSSRISEEGALLRKKANCMGYSLAYITLLEKAGIQAKCVTSERMDHMWNLVKIGGQWYHVDLVWDAPLSAINGKNMYGYVCHDNFLVSNAAIKKTGHEGFSASASSTRYDNKYWRKIESSFWYYGGKYYYANNHGIYVRKRLAGGSARRIKKGRTLCLVQYRGRKFYCISGDRILRLDVRTKKSRAVYRPPAGTNLVQLKCDSKKLYFRYMPVQTRKLHTGKKKI